MRPLELILLLGLTTVWMGASAAVSGQRITLHTQANVAGMYFTLGDIATVTGSDKNLSAALAATRIGVVPPIGYPLTISSQKVRAAMRMHAETREYKTRWDGADTVVVRCRTRQYGSEQPLASARRALVEYLSTKVPDATAISVTATSSLTSIDLPDGDVHVSTRIGNAVNLARRMVVWVDIAVNGNRYRTIPVWFNVKVEKPVLVASTDIPARHALQASDVQTVERDIAGLAGVPLSNDADLGYLRARKAIASDSVIVTQAVERRPLVLRLQPVVVRVAVGAVHISTQAVAEAEGRAGDMIRVRNPISHETYIAQVIGPGTVEVSSR